MKIMPTLEGGLRIDIEDDGDWKVLMGITHDALACDESLGRRMGNLITDEEVAPDWEEYIIPDLEESFQGELSHVATAVAAARLECGGGAGPLWIKRDDAGAWYGALNQARLALEEIHHFGPGEKLNPAALSAGSRNAFLRSQFYCAVQSLLLEYVMR
jgi:hypothetical protein